MPRIKGPQPWVEMHFRAASGAYPKSMREVRAVDYVMCGGPIPFTELVCVSDVYVMFREMQPGFSEWLSRPIAVYDIVTLCRPLPNGRILAHPLIILPESVAKGFLEKDAVVTRPTDYSSHPPKVFPGVVLVGCSQAWESKRLIH